jgi:hypothetical protein
VGAVICNISFAFDGGDNPFAPFFGKTPQLNSFSKKNLAKKGGNGRVKELFFYSISSIGNP